MILRPWLVDYQCSKYGNFTYGKIFVCFVLKQEKALCKQCSYSKALSLSNMSLLSKTLPSKVFHMLIAQKFYMSGDPK